MSYNTRRSGNQYGGGRGSLSQNFVPGGQFQTPSKPIVQMPRQQQKPYQPLPAAPLKSALKNSGQQNQQLQQVHPKPNQNQQQMQQKPPMQQTQQKPPVQQQVPQKAPVPQQTQQKPPVQQQTQAKPVVQQQAQNKPVIQTQVKPAVQQPAPQKIQSLAQTQVPDQPKPQPVVKREVPVQPAAPVVPVQPVTLKVEEPTPTVEQMETVDAVVEAANEEMDEAEDGSVNGKKKSFWRHIKAGKISKKEKRGRRNQRLRKILQPKNALMVLNELVGGQKYTIIESPHCPAATDMQDNFAATVVVEGQEYMGYGKNKNSAKSSAAENALRNILINKLRPTIKANQSASQTSLDSEPTDVIMTEAEESKAEDKADEDDISWLHVASYAIHKLFDSWDADGMLSESTQSFQADLKYPAAPKAVTKRPAKQLPANAELMNPVMLLNQMRPGIMYEDHSKEGSPPAITFTIRCVCDGEEFFGKGNNKKIARKNCAYAACSKVFDIKYPEEPATIADVTMQ